VQDSKPSRPEKRLSRIARMIALAGVVVLAVAGSTWGYSALSKTVTLSLDGKTHDVTAFGGTVGDVLKKQDITIGEHDVVAPSASSPL